MPRVIVIFHHDKVRDICVHLLKQLGCEVWAFGDAKIAAQELLVGEKYDAVFLCLFLESSFQFLRFAQTSLPSTPIIALTVFNSERKYLEEHEEGVAYILSEYTLKAFKTALKTLGLL